MNLFIDTNVFLSFYHLTSEDLEELKKLAVLLDQKKVDLFLPQQVVDEFRRNREVKIADALKRFQEEKLNNQFPQICKEYDEYERMQEAIGIYQRHKSRLLERLNAEIASETLKADTTISELFGKARKIEITSEIKSKARDRMFLGNPPGKNNSSGDAINWECLLLNCPNGEDLYFVTGDGDYSSVLDRSEFSLFLKKEWDEEKSGRIIFFDRLSAFFESQFPTIRLASELEKELLIRNLSTSPNFATARRVLRQLVRYDDFTAIQLNDIVDAATTNNQVYWIADDPDINHYLRKLIKGRERDIEPDALEQFNHILEPSDDSFEIEVDESV